MRRKVWLLIGVFVFWSHITAHGFVFINEILSDPPPGVTGDANNDGIRSSSSDEFIELYNSSNVDIDMSGWYLTDAVSTRHIFLNNTFFSPNSYFVIFGGGSPNLPGLNWQIASSGSLGLNNSGDVLSLFTLSGDLVDVVTYGSLAASDQSIVRLDSTNQTDFILHSLINGAEGKLFSPGESETPQILTPEPASFVMLLFAFFVLFGVHSNRHQSF